MKELKTIEISSIDELEGLLFDNNKILKFKKEFFLNENILKVSSLINDFNKNNGFKTNSFLIIKNNFHIHYLLIDDILILKHYNLMNYEINKIYDIRVKPYQIEYNNNSITCKKYHSIKTKPKAVVRLGHEQIKLIYDINYSLKKAEIYKIFTNYGSIYEIEVKNKNGQIIKLSEAIYNNGVHNIFNFNIKLKNLEKTSRNNKKILEIMKIFNMIDY